MITTPEQMREAAIAAVETELAKAKSMFANLEHYDLYFDGLQDALIRIRAIRIAPQSVAVTVKPLVDRFNAGLSVDGNTASVVMEQCEGGYWVRISDYEALAALTIHPADPLSDPRVKALVDAAKRALNYLENTESEFGITLESADSVRDALRAIGGEA